MAWARVCAVAGLLSVATWLSAGEMTAELARELFVKVETLARATEKEQAAAVPWLYRDAFPQLDRSRCSLALSDFAFLKDAEKRTPEQQADRVLADKRAGWPWLVEQARERAGGLLRQHRAAVRALLEADLKSRDAAAKGRALRAVRAVPDREVFDLVLAIFQGGGEMSGRAAYALRDLADPRAIPHLVAADPKRPAQHFELLRNLQSGRSAHPSLVALLSAKDATTRWQAAYALAGSGDPALIPHVNRLAQDPEPQVRKHAASIGFGLPKEAFLRVRPALLLLLADPDARLRVFIARCFAWRKDTACAKTLLALIQDGSLGERPHSNVYQAIHTLAGTYFGYYHGSDGWRPTTERNRAAIARFAQWVREHAEDR